MNDDIKKNLDAMTDDELFKLLDERSKELNQTSRPLGKFHSKLFNTTSDFISGKDFDDHRLSIAREIGDENDKKVADKIQNTMDENGLKPANLNVKNIKTHRSQWFD